MFDPDEQPGEAEPDPEPDPEADLPDPESELPTVPSVSVPEPPAAETDAPPELLEGFWTTVLVFNVALLATSVGVLMLVFDVRRGLGAGVLLVGLLSLARGYHKYRALERQQAERTADG